MLFLRTTLPLSGSAQADLIPFTAAALTTFKARNSTAILGCFYLPSISPSSPDPVMEKTTEIR